MSPGWLLRLFNPFDDFVDLRKAFCCWHKVLFVVSHSDFVTGPTEQAAGDDLIGVAQGAKKTKIQPRNSAGLGRTNSLRTSCRKG
jgi:hypothetical protein